jgi:hypothetical protein
MRKVIYDHQVATALLHKSLAAKLYKDLRELLALRDSSIETLILAGIFSRRTEYNFRQFQILPGLRAVLESCSHAGAYLQFSFRRNDQIVSVLIDPHENWKTQLAARIFRPLPELQTNTFFGSVDATSRPSRFRKYRRLRSKTRPPLVRIETIVAFAADYGFKTKIGMVARRKRQTSYTALRVWRVTPPSHDESIGIDNPGAITMTSVENGGSLQSIHDSASYEFKGFHAVGGSIEDIAVRGVESHDSNDEARGDGGGHSDEPDDGGNSRPNDDHNNGSDDDDYDDESDDDDYDDESDDDDYDDESDDDDYDDESDDDDHDDGSDDDDHDDESDDDDHDDGSDDDDDDDGSNDNDKDEGSDHADDDNGSDDAHGS